MQTLHSVLKHGGLFSDWDLLPQSMFADRYARVQAAISEKCLATIGMSPDWAWARVRRPSPV